MPTTTTTTEPAIWIGCLACYTNGRLTGNWCQATEGEAITPEHLHGGPTSHEELWVFDHEGLPVSGEMSPGEAARIARRIAEVEDHHRDAFRAWVLHASPTTEADGLPCISSFTEVYVGKWESFDSYAHELAEDTGLLTDVPEEYQRYFHWRAWISDLAMDYTVVDAPDGDAFIFQDV